MALPTVADAKSYLRVETTAEDALFAQLLARAKASIEGELGYPLAAAARTHVDYDETDNYGQRPRLALPGPFKTADPAPVVTDADGVTVSSTEYIADARGLRLVAAEGVCFPRRPYSILATIGLDAHPDYAARLELIASIAIIELIAHWHFNRNPAQISAVDEGGSSVVTQLGEIPTRVMDEINKLPGRMGGMILS